KQQIAAKATIRQKTAEQYIANKTNVGDIEAKDKKDLNDSHLTEADEDAGISENDAASQIANLRDLEGIEDKIEELEEEYAKLYNDGKTEKDLQEVVDRASEAYEEASSYVKRQKEVVTAA